MDKKRLINLGVEIKDISNELNISFDEAISLYNCLIKIDDYNMRDKQYDNLINSLDEINSNIKVLEQIRTAIYDTGY